jgi:hypothetical protein
MASARSKSHGYEDGCTGCSSPGLLRSHFRVAPCSTTESIVTGRIGGCTKRRTMRGFPPLGVPWAHIHAFLFKALASSAYGPSPDIVPPGHATRALTTESTSRRTRSSPFRSSESTSFAAVSIQWAAWELQVISKQRRSRLDQAWRLTLGARPGAFLKTGRAGTLASPRPVESERSELASSGERCPRR